MTRLWPERPRNRGSFAGKGKMFLLCQSHKPFLDPNQPPIRFVTWVKLAEPKADHSFPFGAEVENEWTTSPCLYAPGVHRTDIFLL